MEFETGDGEIRCIGPGNALRLDFDRRLMLQFRGSLITSDAPGIATTRYRPYVSLTIAIFAGVLTNVRGRGTHVRRYPLDCPVSDAPTRQSS
jgi:hypothetical protein